MGWMDGGDIGNSTTSLHLHMLASLLHASHLTPLTNCFAKAGQGYTLPHSPCYFPHHPSISCPLQPYEYPLLEKIFGILFVSAPDLSGKQKYKRIRVTSLSTC